MGTIKFSMRMLVKDYKKSLFYGITLIFAVAVCFVFFNIINNPDLADQAIAKSGGTWNDVQMPFSSVLSFLIICFCCNVCSPRNNHGRDFLKHPCSYYDKFHRIHIH